jgi:uncharacterized protein YqjF (DUF2071 family)
MPQRREKQLLAALRESKGPNHQARMSSSLSKVLQIRDHRPWPMPDGSWTMTQRWHDLLFAHWPVPVETLRALVPPQLAIHTFAGQGWVGVVPFRMAGVRPRRLMALPWLSAFPELNVRTYVTAHDPQNPKPGVFFFSLDAANPLAVTIARRWYQLPYFRAQMRFRDAGRHIHYASRRTHGGAPPAEFVGVYGPTGAVTLAQPGTLEHWLTERYCLYTVDSRNRLWRAEIHHLPWPLQPAEAEIQVNTMLAAAGIALPDSAPLLHFARALDVAVWPLQQLAATDSGND